MFRSGSPAGMPGALLLRVARLVFDESVLASVVQPTIADFQVELRDAGTSRWRRLLARWRGYRAFWTLVVLAPVAFWNWPPESRGTPAFPEVTERIAATLIVVTVLFAIGYAAGVWALVLAMTGHAVIAVAVHYWQGRHPSHVAVPYRAQRPEINISAIRIGGDFAGVLYVVGSIMSGMIGLPMTRWFVLGVLTAGLALAWGLFRWRASHPAVLHPTNSIVCR